MSNTNANDPGGTATVPQILARLCLFMAEHKLPEPIDIDVRGARERIDLDLRARKDLTAWLNALGHKASEAHVMPYSSGGSWASMRVYGWHGWKIDLNHRDLPSKRTELDADTVAGLEEIAAGPALVSEATIAEAEQLGRMVALADLGLPQADCGCPIKSSCGRPVVDHCEACKINEVDVAPVTVEAPAVEPVITDAAQRILNGLAWRIDDRRNPEAGIDWAIHQAEVVETYGPNADGEAMVELVDGTHIDWIPTSRLWVVAVPDDTAAVTE